jgi:hypothetical protein
VVLWRNTLPLAAFLIVSCERHSTVPSGPSSPIPPLPTVGALVVTAPSTLRQSDPPAQATFYVTLQDGSRIEPSRVKCLPAWGSSAPAVAAVSPTGLIEPVGGGDTIIDLQCGDLRAQFALRVRRTFQLVGWVLEQYDGKPVAGATVTLASGEDAGMERQTDGTGRFEFVNLVDSTANLRIVAGDFQPRTASVPVNGGDVRVPLEPLLLEKTFSMSSTPDTMADEFVFETRHTGPVTLALHADCPVPNYSYGQRLGNRLGVGSKFQGSNFVFGVGLGDGELLPDPSRSRTDASETRTLPPNRYVRDILAVAGIRCGWTATVRYP